MYKSTLKSSLKKSFLVAFRGLFLMIKSERNARIHFSAAILVVIAGFIFKIAITEWMIVLILIALVISAEMFNTAVEKLADLTEPNENHQVMDLKDIAAGAVLWISIVSVIIGIIIFAPQILQLIDADSIH